MDPQRPIEQRCRDIVAAYRGERMPDEARAAAWARLRQAIDRGEVPASAGRGERGREIVWAAVLVAAAVLAWIAGTRGLPGREDSREAGSQAAHEAASTSGTPVPTSGGRATKAREERAEAAIDAVAGEVPPAPAPAARSVPAPKDMPSLDAELALLRAAREALGRGEPAAALPSLERHRREFPGGVLVEERMLLRAQALCELGRSAEARASAAELVRAFPSSPHARTAAGLCEE